MRKKSFWLSLNSRNPPPHRGARRPPRHPCTRRPVSSEAPGRRFRRGHGARVQKRRSGHQPRRRPPTSSASSSSSSSCLLRFPAVVPIASPARCSVPGPASPGHLVRPPFERVQVSENRDCLSVGSGAVRRPVRAASVRPAPLRSREAQVQLVRQAPTPSVSPVYHPVRASCSARLLFVLFMVRISSSFCIRFSSFSFGLPCSLHSCSFSACFRSSCLFRSSCSLFRSF